jgi:hypothetical protein
MALDGYVRCRCIQDGNAKPHPFPARLALDETAEPVLDCDPSMEEWEAHDQWFAESCVHAGYLASERLGNISRIAHVRDFLRCLQGKPGPRFPILLTKVVYDGTHSGDWLPSGQAPKLLKEVQTVLHSSDILADSEKEFFTSMKRLGEASIATGNPIMF